MNIRFLTLAEKELDDAVLWYEEQALGLGREFLDEFDRAVRRAVAFPQASPEIESGLYRCLLARFPYAFIYSIDQSTLVVLAVTHLHREPRYWVDRMK